MESLLPLYFIINSLKSLKTQLVQNAQKQVSISFWDVLVAYALMRFLYKQASPLIDKLPFFSSLKKRKDQTIDHLLDQFFESINKKKTLIK